MFTTMNCDFLETKYYYSSQQSDQGEESCDTLDWLRYVTASEVSSPAHSTTSPEIHVQSSLKFSAAEDIPPILTSEVSDSQPNNSQKYFYTRKKKQKKQKNVKFLSNRDPKRVNRKKQI